MLGLPNLYLWLGSVALAAVISAAGAGWTVHKVDQSAYEALQLADANTLIAQKAANDAKSSQAAATLEIGNSNAKVIYRTITNSVEHVVDRPVYLNTCFDPDGLQLANAALAGVTVASPSGPPAALPATVPAK